MLSEELRSPGTGAAIKNDRPDKTNRRTDGAVSVVFRIAEVEERIERQREEMARAVLEVMDIIDLLPADSIERAIVEMRHIDQMTWQRIADALPMARSNVAAHYNRALDNLAGYKRVQKLVRDFQKARGKDHEKIRTQQDKTK